MRRRDIFWLVFGSFTAVPLRAMNFREYPATPASSISGAVSRDGLVVAAVAMTAAAEQHNYFQVTFARKGFFPVYISLENRASAERFFIRREDIGVFSGGRERTNSGDVVTGRSKVGERVMLASSLALSVGGELIAAHMMVRATEIRQNIIKKEFRSVTLGPRELSHGFVYLPIPLAAAEAGSLVLRIRAVKMADGEPIDFEFRLSI